MSSHMSTAMALGIFLALSLPGCSIVKEAETNALVFQLLENGDSDLEAGKLEQAFESYERARKIALEIPHHDLAARASKGMADVRMNQRRHDEAFHGYLDAASSLVEHDGFNPPALASLLILAGQAAARTDDPSRALAHFKRAEKILQSLFPQGHEEIARALHGMGEALLAAGDPEGARMKLEQARAMRERLLGADHPKTLETMNLLKMIEPEIR